MKKPRDLYQVQEVAKMFNITTATLRNWIRQYNIKTHITPCGIKRFSEEDVEQIRDVIYKKYKL